MYKLEQFARPLGALALAVFMGAAVAAESDEGAELERIAESYNAEVEDEGSEVVCRMVATVGSRIKQKQCRTRSQMKQDQDEGKRYLSKHKGVVTQEQ
jgi:hypothetical protein